MPFDISEFNASLQNYGYLKNNIFEVYVTPPPILQGQYDVSYLQYRVERVSIPGVSILSADNAPQGVGPLKKFPFSAQFNEINLYILCDRNADQLNFWNDWLNGIYGFNGGSIGGNLYSMPSYTSGYRDDFATTVTILLYGVDGTVAQKVDLVEAFPTGIREIPLAWDANGELVKLSVSMTFSGYQLI